MTGVLIGTLFFLVALLWISGLINRMQSKIKYMDHEWFVNDIKKE